MPFLEINLSDIVFDPKVQTYCVNPNFKCPSYGHSWACPPVAPYLEKDISQYTKFYLIYSILDLNEYIKKQKSKHPKKSKKRIKNKLFMNNFLRDKLEEEIYIFIETYQYSYNEKFILWDGFCRICFNEVDRGCTYDSGKPCRYPNKKRYSMEAIGIDVTETVQRLNLKIEWPPSNYVYRFGLICFK